MGTICECSPMDLVRMWRLFFRAMDLNGDEKDSTIIKQVHKILLFVWNIAMYLSVFLLDVSLFTGEIPETNSRKAPMALAISKILIKSVVFLVQKREITQMWRQLGNQAFKTKNMDEMK